MALLGKIKRYDLAGGSISLREDVENLKVCSDLSLLTLLSACDLWCELYHLLHPLSLLPATTFLS